VTTWMFSNEAETGNDEPFGFDRIHSTVQGWRFARIPSAADSWASRAAMTPK